MQMTKSKYDFAFNPDNGPARLFRYVEPGVLPDDVICVFHEDDNLLIINRELFELLSDVEKKQVLRTREPSLIAQRDGNSSRTHDEWTDWSPDEGELDAA